MNFNVIHGSFQNFSSLCDPELFFQMIQIHNMYFLFFTGKSVSADNHISLICNLFNPVHKSISPLYNFNLASALQTLSSLAVNFIIIFEHSDFKNILITCLVR